MGEENPKERFGRLKPALRFVPSALNLVVSRVMELGAKKYGPFNWRTTPVSLLTYLDAIERHLMEVRDGLDVDPESGVTPVAHIGACVAIILDAKAHGTLIDDRFARGPASKLIVELTRAETTPPETTTPSPGTPIARSAAELSRRAQGLPPGSFIPVDPKELP